MSLINFFSRKDIHQPSGLMAWDGLLFVLILSSLFLISSVASDMVSAYQIGDPIEIDLSMSRLPYYALRTVVRMFVALFFSLIVAFGVGSLAAKKPNLEKIIIPAIDVLQSIPVIGFLEITFVWFLYAFKGSFLGPELVSIFAVFVSQVWNLILSFYQSLKVMPRDYDEVMRIYQLSTWQRFFRLEVPFAAPGLIWNSMLSLSAGWFFVVEGESMAIANHQVSLPGIGSYIAVANEQGDFQAIYAAIACLFIVIILYDQLIFRPLNQWLMHHNNPESVSRSWVLNLFSKSSLPSRVKAILAKLSRLRSKRIGAFRTRRSMLRTSERMYSGLAFLMWLVIGWVLFQAFWVVYSIPLTELQLVMTLGAYTALRVFVLVLLCCVIWFPIGIYIGLNAKAGDVLQPIIQFLAAFPPNMLYPLFASIILVRGYNPDIWLSPLIVLGTQWYILFNIIAGVRALPAELLLMAKSLNLSGWQYFRRVIMPGVLPSLMTGIITAVGGAWNASIVAEAVSWNGQMIYANGLGAYIMRASSASNPDLVCLGVVVMCIYVLLINRLVWVPLYRMIEERYGGSND